MLVFLYLFLEKIHMSHHPERKEKDCLNCGATVQGRFCHVCGQENIVPKESFWHLVRHFFYDVTHFDGKFFHSLKYLFLRPGFLPAEYLRGRRASYLNPIRMYVFTSAFFFLLFFSFFYSDDVISETTVNKKTVDEISRMDSATFAVFTANINKEDGRAAEPMTRAQFQAYLDTVFKAGGIHFTPHRYTSRAEYDSLIATGAKKHNWVERQLVYKEISMNEKYQNDPRKIVRAFRSKFLHSLPQMLFISLPLFALVLQLLYVRRKQFYYMNHIMFSIYLYIFVFLAMLVQLSISKLNSEVHWGILNVIQVLISLGLFAYGYIALRNFYRQGWLKTFAKFILINILFFIVVLLLFIIFTFFSFFEI